MCRTLFSLVLGACASGAAFAQVSLPVLSEARARFLGECRQAHVAHNADAARWADEQCMAEWSKVGASAAATDALLSALPAAPGEAVLLAALRQRLGRVPGRAPFRLEVAQRTAPVAKANSYYGATIDLSGMLPAVSGPRQACVNPSNLR